MSLNGTQGPHDGWLVVILAVPALLWARSMARGSWVGVVGVLGTALVIGWTALASWRDSREVLGASVGYGLLLVVAASLALAAAGVARGVELLRARDRPGGSSRDTEHAASGGSCAAPRERRPPARGAPACRGS